MSARVVVLAGLHREHKTNLFHAYLLRRMGLRVWFLMGATAP
jgi:hypothetical protein